MNARQMLEVTEPETEITLGTKETRLLAREILDTLRDPQTRPQVAMRVARAIFERKISANEVTQILDYIEANRNRLNSTGAYFCACMKHIFQKAEMPW